MSEVKDADEAAPRLNLYQCKECLHIICTVDRDEGVTPFMLGCRAPSPCRGWMESSFYRVFPGLKPTWEWYRPTDEERASLKPGEREHVERGGLLIRPIMTEKAKAQIADAAKKAAWSRQ
ncbi:hypothetical protein [Hyphomicrobium sp. DY-1]|uniref:hypothetical protein n=1 Tax=Hyphomicrobium sp. DY-1 TaxID=3075650 RepID=UPI0039C090BB